jgi:effector-binding domain-containing protein
MTPVEVTVRAVEPTPTAVVVASTSWEAFPSQWKPMLDAVWAFLASAPVGVVKSGHNIMLYKDDVPNVEVGVQIGGHFEQVGAVQSSELPGGLAAVATHLGPIARIGETHDAVRQWCMANGYRIVGARWEVYGDPDPITGHFPVDVYWSVLKP